MFKNETLIETKDSIKFTGLDYYSNYCVIVTLKYDLNDGNRTVSKENEYNYKTLPFFEVSKCKVINTSAVSEGETIYMQISLNNPTGAIPSSVSVNNQIYNCTGSTTSNKVYVEIVNNGQFEGGLTELLVDKINFI